MTKDKRFAEGTASGDRTTVPSTQRKRDARTTRETTDSDTQPGRTTVPAAQRKRDARTTREATNSGPQPSRTTVPVVDQGSNVKASFPPVHSFLKSKRKLPHLQSPGSVYFITLSANTGVEFTGEERDIILGACRYWEGKKLTLHAAVVMPDHVHLLMQPLETQAVTNARATVPVAQRKRDACITRETTGSGPQTGRTTAPAVQRKRDACTTREATYSGPQSGRTTVPVVQKKPGFYSLSKIMHSIKSYTAHEINKLRDRKGSVWLHESYDRIMRDYEEFEEKLRYISMNPIKAGIADEAGRYKWLYFPGDAVE